MAVKIKIHTSEVREAIVEWILTCMIYGRRLLWTCPLCLLIPRGALEVGPGWMALPGWARGDIIHGQCFTYYIQL